MDTNDEILNITIGMRKPNVIILEWSTLFHHFFFNLSKYIATQEFFSCVNVEMANSFRLWTFNHQPISSPLISIYLPIWNDVPHITRSNGGSRHFYSRLTVNHIYPYSFERPHNICFMQYAYRQTKFRKFKLWVKASLNYSFGKR